jgi:hypothetical protein
MPASKDNTASQIGRGAAKAPSTARAAKRAAPKPPQSERKAPRSPEAYQPSAWGTTANFEVTTPSGQTCLAHELSVEKLMEMGLLQAIDALSGIVEMKVLPGSQGKPPEVDMQKVMSNGKQLMEVMNLVNMIVCAGVVEPQVHPVVDQDGNSVERVNGRVYVDSIPLGDRFFLFNEITGGLESFAAFR